MIIFWKFDWNLADSFYAAGAWTDIENPSLASRDSRCTNSLQNVFPGERPEKKLNLLLITNTTSTKNCQNAALSFNEMHLNIPSTDCRPLCWAQGAPGWPGQALPMRGSSPLVQSCRYLTMMTRNVFNDLRKAWSMNATLISVYAIFISSSFRHSSAPLLHVWDYW